MDTDEPISRGINMCGQTLDVDPRTGHTIVNSAKPFSKGMWNEVTAKPHTLTVVHADGSESVVTVAGATYPELRDDDFMAAVATGQSGIWDRKRVTRKQWHAFVLKLAALHPDKVVRQDGYKSVKPKVNGRVIVSARVPASFASVPPEVNIT